MMWDEWRERAACLDASLEVFFPTGKGTGDDRWDAARAYCSRCSVQRQCLNLVIGLEEADDRWGFFGGYTPMERREIRAGYKEAFV
jgi:hypothetical protein